MIVAGRHLGRRFACWLSGRGVFLPGVLLSNTNLLAKLWKYSCFSIHFVKLLQSLYPDILVLSLFFVKGGRGMNMGIGGWHKQITTCLPFYFGMAAAAAGAGAVLYHRTGVGGCFDQSILLLLFMCLRFLLCLFCWVWL